MAQRRREAGFLMARTARDARCGEPKRPVHVSTTEAQPKAEERGKLESRMMRKCPVRFGGGCDPFSRNLERSKGMGAKGSVRTFENLLGVWVRTDVQLPPSGCMRDGSTLMPSPDTRRHGTRQG